MKGITPSFQGGPKFPSLGFANGIGAPGGCVLPGDVPCASSNTSSCAPVPSLCVVLLPHLGSRQNSNRKVKLLTVIYSIPFNSRYPPITGCQLSLTAARGSADLCFWSAPNLTLAIAADQGSNSEMAEMAHGRSSKWHLVKYFILRQRRHVVKNSAVQLPPPRAACDSGKRSLALVWRILGRLPYLLWTSFFLSEKWRCSSFARLSLNC